MKNSTRKNLIRAATFILIVAAMIGGMAQWSSVNVSANHPVLVEGNCDSPVPGTTLVSPGTCGDFDGDGRIGTAEDTDGADRIFGTINAALGPGTGAAAGTGANHNGTITIVSSGRFAEVIYIGQQLLGPGSPGVANPGNVTLEAAPGVNAQINAVLQGDPSGMNVGRQGQFGVAVSYTTNAANRMVTLRNLTIRNFDIGVWASNDARLVIDNCVIEGNLNYGVRVSNTARVVIVDSKIVSTGFRNGAGVPTVPTVGNGLTVDNSARARISNSVFAQNAVTGIANNTGSATNVQIYKVVTYFNGLNIGGPVTVATDPNFAQ